jgi:glycosyltransferase involved in cell wall biosynthesis
MKILCVIDSLGSGGAQRQLVELAKGFKQRGHEVAFLVYHHEPFFLNEILEYNIKYNCIEERSYMNRILKIRKFIRESGSDIVISFLDTSNFLNCISKLGGSKWKVITAERSSNLANLTSLKGRFYAYFQRYSDVIVCNSERANAMWKENYPEFFPKLTTIYNLISIPAITSNYVPKKDNKTHVIIAASYQYLKNPIRVIKALLLLTEKQRELIQIHWYGRAEVIMGDSNAYNESIDLIKKYNLDSTVFLNKETRNIANIMNQGDFVALFSELEGLPNVICEGMKLGKPIIMTRVSDYKKLVDGTNGFLCDWNNLESIKNTFLAAINLSQPDMIKMGENSRLKAELLFSKNEIIEKWTKLIEN